MPSEAELIEPFGAPSNRFLYRTLAEALRQRIVTGVYVSGVQIPTVAELAAEFKVSTITVRHAIRDLSLEGLLVGRQGRGVFVALKRRIVRSLSVDRIVPIEQDMADSGVRASLQDQGVKVARPGDAPFLAELGRGQKQLLRLDRILLADGEAVGLDVVWITSKLARTFADVLHGQFLMSQLVKRGVKVEHLRYQVEASTATEDQAHLLDVVDGFPLLVIRYFPIGPAGNTILVGQTTTRADRFTYQFGARMAAPD